MFRTSNFIPAIHSELLRMEDSDDLKCCHCAKSFVVKRRNPYLLRCLHSMCETCLDAQEDTLVCKICDVLGKKREDPQIDYVRLNEYVLSMALENPDRLKCTNQSDGKNAKVYCFECNHFLCDDCLSFHSQIDSTKGHVSVRLTDLTSHPLSEWQAKEKCSLHSDYPVSFFCHETACRRLICLLCFTQSHSGHNTQDIDEAYELERDLLVHTGQHLQSRVSALQELVAKRKEAEANKTKVRETFALIRTAVSQRRQQLLQIVDYQYEVGGTRADKRQFLRDTATRLRHIYNAAMAFHSDPEYQNLAEDVNNVSKPTDFAFHYDRDTLVTVLSKIQSFGQVRNIQPESLC